MAKLSEKQILLAVGGAALLLCGGGGAGVWWAMGLVQEQEQAIQQKQRQIDACRRKIRKIPKIEEAVIILRENVHQYVKILPQEKELNKFMKTAQRFAVQSGIAIEKAMPGRQGRGKRKAFESVVYRFEFQANLWQLMKFINFFENYERFAKLKQVRMTPFRARGGNRQGGEITHKFSVTVETYVYNVKAKGKLTNIPNYLNKRDKLAHSIQATLQDLSTERYEFKGQQGRRDIFVDPREFHDGSPDVPGGGDHLSPGKQRELIEKTSAQIATFERYWKESKDPSLTIFKKYELRKKVRTGMVSLTGDIDNVTERNLISNQALKVRWYKEVLMPLKRLKGEVVHERETDKYLGVEDFNQLIQDLKSDLLEGRLQQAVNRYENVLPKLEVPAGDERYALRIRIEGYILRARVAQEFAAMPLDIAGVVVNQDGKSGVILNKTVYQEGDWVTDQLFIKAVRREEVEFVFKGFTLVKTW